MDNIKEKIEELVNKIKSDKNFSKKFKENPVEAVESIIGIDLPDDKINQIIDAVKAKINVDNTKDIANKLKGLLK